MINERLARGVKQPVHSFSKIEKWRGESGIDTENWCSDSEAP